MGIENDKPSQAEGEDPERPEEGSVLPTDDHPSQAEGADGTEDAQSGE
jgi:hypothetical protein